MILRARPLARVALALFLLACSASASAQDAGVPAITRVDTVEHVFGASNVNAVAGHGGLTAGISRDGDVTVLAWPSPSCCDQLTYLASNALDARSLPHYGALDGMGVVIGVAFDGAAGSTLSWLDDGTWTVDQRYLDDTSLLPVTHFRSDARDLDVTITDSVPPDADVLQRRVVLVRGPAAAAGTYAFVTFANLGPTQSQIPELPLADWALDSRNDFGAVWDDASGTAIQFHPAGRDDVRSLGDAIATPDVDYGPLDALLAGTPDDPAALAAFVSGLDAAYGDGVYAAVTTLPPPSEHQVGYDATPFCGALGEFLDRLAVLPSYGIPLPIDPSAADVLRCTDGTDALRTAHGWTHDAADARADAIAGDGHLSGASVAAGRVDLALRTPLDASGSVTIRIAFAHSAVGARAVLTGLVDPGAIEAADQAAWHAVADTFLVPTATTAAPIDPGTEVVTRVTRRALLHDVAGTARDTGAIVASIARQAPYGIDWPRDGAFFDYAFDVAGDPARVTRRLEWIAPLLRGVPIAHPTPIVDAPAPLDPITMRHDYPADAWEMNYYADGTTGGNIRFEIDNTALMVWSMGAHIGYLDEPERARVADELYPVMLRAANLIAAWRDPATGLDALASEDDTITFTSGLHGAVTVFAALESAARVARYRGDVASAVRWEARAGELRDAILTQLYDPASGLFFSMPSADGVINIGMVANGDTAWLVWPAELLPFDDARVSRQLRADLMAALAVLRGDGEGGQYLSKNFLAAAVAVTHGADPSLRPLVEEGIARLAASVPTEDTQVYGEVYVNVGTSGAPLFDQRTSNPHLWEGTLTYLAAMALEHPERFDVERMTLPAAQTPPPSAPSSSGCSCRVGQTRERGSVVMALVLLGAVVLRRERARARSLPPSAAQSEDRERRVP
jgi:hypothetical protein